METNNQIKVWDIFVRFFHWSLVMLLIIAYASGDDAKKIHIYTGYLVSFIIAARIFWGFFGTKYALFKNFICSPVKALIYTKELFTGNPKHYTGHNPAAAWMVILFILTCLVVCISGHKEYVAKGIQSSLGLSNEYSFVKKAYADDDEEKEHKESHKRHGNTERAKNKDEVKDGIWHDLHEISAQFLIGLIILHIIGVVASSRVHNENLVKSMITGKKRCPPPELFS